MKKNEEVCLNTARSPTVGYRLIQMPSVLFVFKRLENPNFQGNDLKIKERIVLSFLVVFLLFQSPPKLWVTNSQDMKAGDEIYSERKNSPKFINLR